MPAIENQPTETDLNQETVAQESQPEPTEYTSTSQERADSVADGADDDLEGHEATFSNAHENVSRTEFANAPDVKRDFNEVAPDKKPADGDNGDYQGDGDGDDDEPRPAPPDLNYG